MQNSEESLICFTLNLNHLQFYFGIFSIAFWHFLNFSVNFLIAFCHCFTFLSLSPSQTHKISTTTLHAKSRPTSAPERGYPVSGIPSKKPPVSSSTPPCHFSSPSSAKSVKRPKSAGARASRATVSTATHA